MFSNSPWISSCKLDLCPIRWQTCCHSALLLHLTCPAQCAQVRWQLGALGASCVSAAWICARPVCKNKTYTCEHQLFTGNPYDQFAMTSQSTHVSKILFYLNNIRNKSNSLLQAQWRSVQPRPAEAKRKEIRIKLLINSTEIKAAFPAHMHVHTPREAARGERWHTVEFLCDFWKYSGLPSRVNCKIKYITLQIKQ